MVDREKDGQPSPSRLDVERQKDASFHLNDGKRGSLPAAIVGIGASAGGIEALSRFFQAMPPDSGCAFIVVLHLDPKRESVMSSILGARTAMAVRQVADGMPIEADHVYVIAPDATLTIDAGVLRLSKPRQPKGHRHPVDAMFASLAAERGERAIAIVLSGTGSNGTAGLREIRAEGGMSLVQTPETAKFDGMPRSAITADLADQVLAPEEMPEALLRYVRHGYVATGGGEKADLPASEASLGRVLELLRVRAGHDFRHFKRSTLGRRIHRRLGLRNLETLDAYLDELQANPAEVTTLVRDLMINVTSFFRDAEAWKALADLVIAPMVGQRETGASVRIWVPACSTGEEAYSAAMLAAELAEAAGKHLEVKVFATDAQEENLRKAREGVYAEAELTGLSQARLRRFFQKLDGYYQVTKELRDMVVFAQQNLLRDAPFSRLDLVSCRNFLIYLEPDAQQKVIALCHFSLRPNGFLFLGNAETIGRQGTLFDTVSKKWRIYRRLGATRHDLIDYPARRGMAGAFMHPRQDPDAPAPIADLARRALLDRYAPASAVIDRKGRILYFHGATRDFLEQPPGEPTRDVVAMARDGLAPHLRAALRKASKDGEPVTVSAGLREDGKIRTVTITVAPLSDVSANDAPFLIASFTPGMPAAEPARMLGRGDGARGRSPVHLLQEELKATRAELQSTIEQLETANEELKAANEEATSVNEELQSTNEELETSKEELQSFNEELHTVNNQLQLKIGELENASNDLNNLLAGSETATLFLDTELRIKWFSPATKDLFDLVSPDIGRPVSHFARKFSDDDQLRDAETVLKKLVSIDAEVPSDSGKWYLRRMIPYRTQDNRIAGVVITFSDITDRKHAADTVNEARIYAEAIVETIRQPLLVLDGEFRVQSANKAFYELFKVSKKDTIGNRVSELGNGQWNVPKLHRLLERVLEDGAAIADFQLEHVFHKVGRRIVLLNARKLMRSDRRQALILLAIEDVTELRDASINARRLAAIVKSSDDAIVSKDTDGIITSWNSGAERLFGYSAAEALGKPITILIPPDRQAEETRILEGIRRGEHFDHFETKRLRKDGSAVWVSLSISPLKDGAGRVVGASKIARDMTERRRADEHRRILVGELNHRVKNTLAVVQSIASQTLGHATSVEDARSSFGARLMNLAQAHDVLTREAWAGADLKEMIVEAIKPHAGGNARFQMKGPAIQMTPAAALAVSMAVHELSTNAAKYGALSTDQGRVEIAWQLIGSGEDRRLVLRWIETGGPPVTPPKRKGFGSRMIERALALELAGEVHVAYEPSGVVCTIDAPMPEGQDKAGNPGAEPFDQTDIDR